MTPSVPSSRAASDPRDASAFAYRPAVADDASACVALRGRTRENAVSAEHLASYGITVESWAADIASGRLPGHVCTLAGVMQGYAFGDRASGEVVVLALLPAVEGQGVGRELLARVVSDLAGAGHRRLFLGCSPDPAVRSHGFYRHLGWRPTGLMDAHGDEVLELTLVTP